MPLHEERLTGRDACQLSLVPLSTTLLVNLFHICLRRYSISESMRVHVGGDAMARILAPNDYDDNIENNYWVYHDNDESVKSS